MNNLFHARIITLNEFGYKRIDQEGIYSTFDKAFDFIGTSFLNNPTNRDLKLYRSEIIEIELDSDSVCGVLEYDCKGDLINRFIQTGSIKGNDQSMNFKKGDIIQLRLTDYWDTSNLDFPILGVISDLPMETEEVEEYTIDFISNLGFLDHCHIKPSQFEKYKKALPKELEFLHNLSNHYTRKTEISEDILNDMRRCNVYLKNIKSYKELIT